jgi:hypothetical protein
MRPGLAFRAGDFKRYLLRAPQEGDDREDEKNDEQYLRNTRSAGGNSAESEDSGDDGDNEKYQCVIEHESLGVLVGYVSTLQRISRIARTYAISAPPSLLSDGSDKRPTKRNTRVALTWGDLTHPAIKTFGIDCAMLHCSRQAAADQSRQLLRSDPGGASTYRRSAAARHPFR